MKMKKLFETWNRYLQEYATNQGHGPKFYADSALTMPQRQGIRGTPIPTIQDLLDDWVSNELHGFDEPAVRSGGQWQHTMMPVDELLLYLSDAPEDVDVAGAKFNIINNDIPDSVYVTIGKNGKAKVTGGEDTLLAAKEIGLKDLPTVFSFQIKV
tara:strand:+ start:351 stop:815 length:465 start_codon:yes stop_codon:yes gene_type:complete